MIILKLLKGVIQFSLLLALLMTSPSWALAKTYYISPQGHDSNTGESVSSSLKTLGKALEIAYGKEHTQNDTVIIRVMSGTYRGQSKRVRLGKTIPAVSIQGELKNGKRPIFTDGRQNQIWLIVHANSGQNLKLSIENLEVRKYFSAITIMGDRDDMKKGSEGAVIKNNIFRSIGSQPANSKDQISFGVIRLINTSKNQISGNKFIDIRNAEGCSAIHSIYLAHYSSENEISDNVFDGTCGASIKLRDRANNNLIKGNSFHALEDVSAIQEWFCDKGASKSCKKAEGECPSIGNVVQNNQFPNADSSQYLEIAGKKVQRKWCDSRLFNSKRLLIK